MSRSFGVGAIVQDKLACIVHLQQWLQRLDAPRGAHIGEIYLRENSSHDFHDIFPCELRDSCDDEAAALREGSNVVKNTVDQTEANQKMRQWIQTMHALKR